MWTRESERNSDCWCRSLKWNQSLRCLVVCPQTTDTPATEVPDSFADNDEVFVGPPFFEGLGQFVCRAQAPTTPMKPPAGQTDSDDEFVVDPLTSLSTPLLRSAGKRPPKRELQLTLCPDVNRALRWNLMMS